MRHLPLPRPHDDRSRQIVHKYIQETTEKVDKKIQGRRKRPGLGLDPEPSAYESGVVAIRPLGPPLIDDDLLCVSSAVSKPEEISNDLLNQLKK